MSQSQLEKLVRRYDPLLESLVGGAPEDRAAIWGQAEQESNAEPAAIEKPGTNIGGIGLWQHTGSRRRDLEAFAAWQSKPWQDAETQVRFVGKELIGTYAHAWHQITSVAKTPRAKVETAMALFEAPAGWEQEIQNPGSTTAGLKRRLQGAAWALAVIMAAKSGDGTVTDTSGIDTQKPTVVQSPNILSDWIKKNEVPAETVLKQLLVAKGFPGFLVDLLFSALNPLIDQLVNQIHPEDIGNLIAQHVIQPMLANLNLPKKTG